MRIKQREANPKRRRKSKRRQPISSVMQAHSRFSAVSGEGLVIVLSSDPPPLCPRFLPGIWNPKDVDLLPDCGASLVESPNRAKIPFFLGFVSSFSPTSSNFSSSIGSGFSNRPEDMPGEREKRESREVREGTASECEMGERAQISYTSLVSVFGYFRMFWRAENGGKRTNERR